MAALDFEPNRLGAAKQVIRDFIRERQYDRIGLVIFASEAFSQVPPTLDYTVLQRVLEETQVSWDIGLDSGTAIGLGLANGANMLRDSKADSRVIVLLTDGANNSGQIDPLTAAEIAKALDIRVYTIGAARPGPAALPFPDGRIEYRDSEIDEETLQEIADITGGLYFRAEDQEGLREIYDTINELERSQVEVKTFTQYRELAAWLMLPAALILGLEILLRRTLFRTIP
jgi:Ca-activated chloride channel family protein